MINIFRETWPLLTLEKIEIPSKTLFFTLSVHRVELFKNVPRPVFHFALENGMQEQEKPHLTANCLWYQTNKKLARHRTNSFMPLKVWREFWKWEGRKLTKRKKWREGKACWVRLTLGQARENMPYHSHLIFDGISMTEQNWLQTSRSGVSWYLILLIKRVLMPRTFL